MDFSQIQPLSEYIKSYYWLTSNKIVTPQFVNHFILLVMTLEPKLKNVDVSFDFNNKTLNVILYSPLLYKWKFRPFLKFLVFFLPKLNIETIQKYLLEIFPGWKIYINIQ